MKRIAFLFVTVLVLGLISCSHQSKDTNETNEAEENVEDIPCLCCLEEITEDSIVSESVQ